MLLSSLQLYLPLFGHMDHEQSIYPRENYSVQFSRPCNDFNLLEITHTLFFIKKIKKDSKKIACLIKLHAYTQCSNLLYLKLVCILVYQNFIGQEYNQFRLSILRCFFPLKFHRIGRYNQIDSFLISSFIFCSILLPHDSIKLFFKALNMCYFSRHLQGINHI